MKKQILLLLAFLMALSSHNISAQRKSKTPPTQTKSLFNETTFSGLKLRNIGPALMSGRISDIAIHPKDDNIWYVAVGSGGVWKTVNAGVTWTPVFDNQKVYSIGCVSIDPVNPHIVWVGTGEDIGGRHVGFGDGVYKSEDGGKNWKNMGLNATQHIARIIIHPKNSEIVWVAAQGPLWNKGDERGLYKTTDGGKTWRKTLGDAEWVGVTDIVLDPRNPKRLYAATWQRHRNVASYLGGGPGTGLYKSEDGGESWTKLSKGLPESNLGKIGLAISPQQPDIVYAVIEEDRKTGGLYRSADRGASWKKMSNAVSGATGPHYYQELYASPHQFERLYLMDASMQISDDGGKSFFRMTSEYKHGDNHAIAFRKDDPDYLLVGTDGGLYESFDLTKTWRFFENLPVTQFYKVALDDTEPFYNVFGGTQDNSTQGGPSRTDNAQGIQNSDWRIILDWDGHQPATEPGNPNIMYAERQEGNLSRIDMITGEVIDIQPQPGKDEGPERYNWDAPIFVSPHKATRIYFASHRLWRSENRGDSWTAISGDLTRNQDRFTLPIMGATQGWDNAWDVGAMSNYNTITSISESPQQEDLIYIGTDDGLIQVTENGGQIWQKIEVGSMPGVPATAFVNDIKADLFDANTVYAALDNHKFGDFKPYLMKSNDKGKTWTSMVGNIPAKTMVWRIVQDHEKKDLFFLATEFGIYFSINAGAQWTKLSGDVPTISFRDLAIQRRENDLVGASFGRGFFVLDDYSALRQVSEEQLKQEATLFPARKAWWFIPRSHLGFYDSRGSQGASHYVAPNPEFGAVFTYYLKDGLKTIKDNRKEKEKELKKQNKALSFPGWEAIDAEIRQAKPKIWLTVMDSENNAIRRIEGPSNKGFHRVAWDLLFPSTVPISLESAEESSEDQDGGYLAPPGEYKVQLSKEIDGKITELSGPISFTVERLREGALQAASPEVAAAFWRALEKTEGTASTLQVKLNNAGTRVKAMQKALANSKSAPGELDTRIHKLYQELYSMASEMNGTPAKQMVGEKTHPTIGDRLFSIYKSVSNSTYGPTETNKKTLEIIDEQLSEFNARLLGYLQEMESISKELVKVGAPWVEGGPIVEGK